MLFIRCLDLLIGIIAGNIACSLGVGTVRSSSLVQLSSKLLFQNYLGLLGHTVGQRFFESSPAGSFGILVSAEYQINYN